MQKCKRCGSEYVSSYKHVCLDYSTEYCPDCLENLNQKIGNTVKEWLTMNGNYDIDKKTKGGYKVIVSGKNQDAFAKYVGWIYTKGEWLAAYWDSKGCWKSGPFTTSDTEYDLVFLKDL